MIFKYVEEVMLKRALILLIVGSFLAVVSANAYTVVLKKNGKALTGTLISEDDNSIVFKDDQGLQYSLKKSVLDLDKMKEANTPPPPPPPPPQEQPAETPKEPGKPAKVYTQADVEGLRDKYSN